VWGAIGGWSHCNGWNGMESNMWFPYVWSVWYRSMNSIPAITMSPSSYSSSHQPPLLCNSAYSGNVTGLARPLPWQPPCCVSLFLLQWDQTWYILQYFKSIQHILLYFNDWITVVFSQPLRLCSFCEALIGFIGVSSFIGVQSFVIYVRSKPSRWPHHSPLRQIEQQIVQPCFQHLPCCVLHINRAC
jgi:hypothetical protein